MGAMHPHGLWKHPLEALRSSSATEWVVACTVLLGIIQYAYLPGDAYFSPDEGMRITVSRNLRVDSIFTGHINYPGMWVDPQMQLVPYFPAWYQVTDQPALQVSFDYILFGALLAPFEQLGGMRLAQLLPLLCGLVAGIAAGAILNRCTGAGAARLGAVVTMLALPSSLYSFLIWEHILALALVLLAVVFYMRSRDSAAWAIPALLCLLLACVLRVETSFIAVPLLAWVFIERARAGNNSARLRLALAALLLAGIVAALTIIYVALSTATPYRIPQFDLSLSAQRLEKAVELTRSFLIGYGATDATTLAWLVIALSGMIGALVLRGYAHSRQVFVAIVLAAGSVIAALSLLRVEPFGVTNPGIFALSPLLLAALMPMPLPTPLRFIRFTIWTVIIGYLLSVLFFPALAARPAGTLAQIGSTWANRYFLTLYPLLALIALGACALMWQRSTGWRRMLMGCAVGLACALGIATNLLGVYRIAQDKSIASAVCQPVWQTGSQLVVVDEWWWSVECAIDPYPTWVLVTDDADGLELTRSIWKSNLAQVSFASKAVRNSKESFALFATICYSSVVKHSAGSPLGGEVTTYLLTGKSNYCR